MLCGNTDVTGPNRSRSEAYISEKCLDMQKGKTEKKRSLISNENNVKKKDGMARSSCPLLSSKDAVATLALHMLAEPSDIEDLAAMGQETHTCAYYASRVSNQILYCYRLLLVLENGLMKLPYIVGVVSCGRGSCYTI